MEGLHYYCPHCARITPATEESEDAYTLAPHNSPINGSPCFGGRIIRRMKTPEEIASQPYTTLGSVFSSMSLRLPERALAAA